MLNEDRIKEMTKLAVFEKEHEQEKEIAINYYRKDYVSYHMIWCGIMTTIAYFFCLVLYFALNYEDYMAHMHTMDLVNQGKIIVILYIILLVVMVTISYFIYKKRYKDAQRWMKEYCRRLHELERLYNSERHREYSKQKQEDRL